MKYRARHGYCGGIDVGGTKVASALFTPDGRMLGRKKIPIDQATAEGPVRQITRLIHGLEAKAREKRGELHAIGICIPGIVFGRSGRVWTLNVPGWKHFPLRDRLAVKTKTPLLMDSDRSAYVLGEQWRGVARGKRDVVLRISISFFNGMLNSRPWR